MSLTIKPNIKTITLSIPKAELLFLTLNCKKHVHQMVSTDLKMTKLWSGHKIREMGSKYLKVAIYKTPYYMCFSTKRFLTCKYLVRTLKIGVCPLQAKIR